jgi:hypothetical protein
MLQDLAGLFEYLNWPSDLGDHRRGAIQTKKGLLALTQAYMQTASARITSDPESVTGR